MVAFDRDDLNRVDWALFQNGWVTMYWKPEVLERDAAWLVDRGYRAFKFDCSRWSSAAVALRDLGETLGFPDYYGQNLDAFNDCLSDLEVPIEGGVVIVLRRYDRFAGVVPRVAQALLDILASNARRFMLFGQRLATVIQSDDPKLSFEPVGSMPVTWNRQEWPNSARGV
jgi:RNAse (barnase) inhibitor barstar